MTASHRLQAVIDRQTYAFEYVPDGLTLSDAADIVVSGAPGDGADCRHGTGSAYSGGSLTDPSGAIGEHAGVCLLQTALSKAMWYFWHRPIPAATTSAACAQVIIVRF